MTVQTFALTYQGAIIVPVPRPGSTWEMAEKEEVAVSRIYNVWLTRL